MKSLPNEIVLRPRFQLELDQDKETILNLFEKSQKTPFLIKRMDDHVFIKFNQKTHHFWSPQLHLEINETEQRQSRIYGLFGPPTPLKT